MRRSVLPLAPLLFAAAACGQAAPQQVSVAGAWVRLPAVSGRPGVAYFTLRGGRTAERLVAVSSPQVGRVELHESGMAGGMMTMRPLNNVAVPAGAEVRFAPSGNHAMLFDIAGAVKAGTQLPMIFYFQSGKTAQATAKVVGAGDDAPAL